MHIPTLPVTSGKIALQTLSLIIIAALDYQINALAADTYSELGYLNTGTIYSTHNSTANGISADGRVVVGLSENSLGHDEAFRWIGGSMTGLGFLNKGDLLTQFWSYANAASADGNVIVGTSINSLGYSEAFRWAGGTMTGLGSLATGSFSGSNANGVSADGNVVVGSTGTNSYQIVAFRWVGGSMTELGFLDTGTFSWANGVSADGNVVVGISTTNGMYHHEAFRWAGGTMTGLGFLNIGTKEFSEAKGVSADGNVVVGYSDNSLDQMEAFRWKGGTMTGLGFLYTGEIRSQYWSIALGTSADGSVVVGRSINNSCSYEAFRWTQATGMQTIVQWLAEAGITVPLNKDLLSANGVNGNGNVVVGNSRERGDYYGDEQAWLARVGPEGTGFITDIPAFNSTLIEAASHSVQAAAGLPNLVMTGAHHRSLLDSGLTRTQDGACAWAIADAAHNNQTNTSIELIEAGACKDFNTARIGLGVGTAQARQDWSLGGNANYDGHYLLSEFANAFSNRMEVSITGYYGGFDSKLHRNYMNGESIDRSDGTPDTIAMALRARLDWKDVIKFGQFSLSPYTAYTWSETKIDTYTETGGGFPAQFAADTWHTNDIRLGVAAKTELSITTSLRLGIEAAYRFEESTSGVRGQVIGLWDFNLPGQQMTQTWARATADLDHRLSETVALTFGANAASSGGDAAWGVTTGLRASF